MEKTVLKVTFEDQKLLDQLAESVMDPILPRERFQLLERDPLVVSKTRAVMTCPDGQNVELNVAELGKPSGLRNLQRLGSAPSLVPRDAPMSVLCGITKILVRELAEGMLRLPDYARDMYGYEGRFVRTVPILEAVSIRGRDKLHLKWFVLFAPKDRSFQVVPGQRGMVVRTITGA